MGTVPPVCPHDIVEQCATSRYLSLRTFVLVRISLLALLWYGLVLQVAEKIYSLLFVTFWSYTLFLISYSALTATTALQLMKRETRTEAIAQFTVPLHFISATAALYVVPVYYCILDRRFPDLNAFIPHGGTLVVHLLDIVAGAKYRFKQQHVGFTLLYLVIYLTFTWSRYAMYHLNPDFSFPYAFLHPQNSSPTTLILIHVALIAWCIAASGITIFSSSICNLSYKAENTQHHS